jgi:hypothetical protein
MMYISVSRAVLYAELLRRQPAMKAGREGILLVIKKLLESRFLVGTALQEEKHAVERLGIRDQAAIVLGACKRVSVSA